MIATTNNTTIAFVDGNKTMTIQTKIIYYDNNDVKTILLPNNHTFLPKKLGKGISRWNLMNRRLFGASVLPKHHHIDNNNKEALGISDSDVDVAYVVYFFEKKFLKNNRMN